MRHWGQLAIANPVAFLATLMLGALLAFVYSYVPLHTVKHRKLERLEHTLLVHEETIASLESELEGARMAASELSQDEALASLESERDEARRNADAARRELKTAEKRARELERERNDWKRKVAALERRTAQAANQRLAEASAEPASPVVDGAPAAAAAVAGTKPAGSEAAAPLQPDSSSQPDPAVLPASPAP
jgi:DNA repair exonuclease SbcCD ATPase subunit